MYEDKPSVTPVSSQYKSKKVDDIPSDNEDIYFVNIPNLDRVLALLAQNQEALYTRSQVKIDKYESVEQGTAPISANKYNVDTQIISMPIYRL